MAMRPDWPLRQAGRGAFARRTSPAVMAGCAVPGTSSRHESVRGGVERRGRTAVQHPSTWAAPSGRLGDMTDATICLADDALTLQSVAERLPDEALNRACAPFAPAVLEAIEHALLDLSRTCYTIGPFVRPARRAGRGHHRSLRTSGGPVARRARRPSAVVRAAGPRAVVAARCRHRAPHRRRDCKRARISLAETMDPMPDLRELQSRHRPPLVD